MSTNALPRALQALRFARLALALGSLVAIVYLARRFELMRLPRTGCSPVLRFAPGSLLVVDRHPPRVHPGDVVLFAVADELLLAAALRLDPRPAERAALWVEADDPGCAARDSRELGWIEPDALRGRVLFALRW